MESVYSILSCWESKCQFTLHHIFTTMFINSSMNYAIRSNFRESFSQQYRLINYLKSLVFKELKTSFLTPLIYLPKSSRSNVRSFYQEWRIHFIQLTPLDTVQQFRLHTWTDTICASTMTSSYFFQSFRILSKSHEKEGRLHLWWLACCFFIREFNRFGDIRNGVIHPVWY